MTTIINRTPGEGDSGAISLVVGIIILIVIGFLFYVFALPAIRNTDNIDTTEDRDIKVDVQLPVDRTPDPAPAAPTNQPLNQPAQ